MTERNLYEVTGDIKDINTLLVNREAWNRRAQPAQAVPLTDAEIDVSSGTPDPTSDYGCGYYAGARWAEARLRGIAGKEGGNV